MNNTTTDEYDADPETTHELQRRMHIERKAKRRDSVPILDQDMDDAAYEDNGPGFWET